MKEARGDYDLAAAGLDCAVLTLKSFVLRDPQLAAIWISDVGKIKTPDEADLMIREMPKNMVPTPKLLGDDVVGEAMLRADRDILRTGLKSAGISEKTIQKLGLMEDMAVNTGRFLGAALDVTHRVTVFNGVALFEESERIRSEYLSDLTLPHEVRIEWAKVYVGIAEVLGKTSDRVLAGTAAAVAMLKKKEEVEGGGKGGKGKPGFEPLKKVGQEPPRNQAGPDIDA